MTRLFAPYFRAVLKELSNSVRLHVGLLRIWQRLSRKSSTSGCLVLDVRLPGMMGLKVQEELAKAKNHLPIIFFTGHRDIAMAVRAIKTGAIDFLTKPFRNQGSPGCGFYGTTTRLRRAAPGNN
jgi:FixJ family two-component response regulator